MNLSQDIIEILKNNNLLDLNNLKQLTREDLKNMNFNNNQINQINTKNNDIL